MCRKVSCRGEAGLWDDLINLAATAWHAQVHSVNCFTARWNWEGIAATAESRTPRDVAGQRLRIRFEIVDRRFGVLAGPVKEGQVDPNRVQRGPYTVFLTLQVCSAGLSAQIMDGRNACVVILALHGSDCPGITCWSLVP